MAMVEAFKKANGVEVNVFSESFEDLQPKASVSANTGQGPDMAWGLHSLPQLFPDKVIEMNDVADYLGKKYGGWTSAGRSYRQAGNKWLGIPVATIGGYFNYRKSSVEKAGFKEIPEGSSRLPRTLQGPEEEQYAGRLRARSRLRRRQCLDALDPLGAQCVAGRQGRQGRHQLAGNRQGAGIHQGVVGNLHSRLRLMERIPRTTRRSCRANCIAPTTASRSTSPPRRSDQERYRRRHRARLLPDWPDRQADRTATRMCRSWRSSIPRPAGGERPSSPSCWRSPISIRG